MKQLAAVLVGIGAATGIARAAPPVPSGPHPRILLDPALRAAWKQQAGSPGPVHGAITLCDEAGSSNKHDHAEYQGAVWAEVLQACLVAYAATDSKDHLATALRFYTALLDDLELVGDGKGGDAAAKRDSGYAIRNLGPYTAIAYDWLHDAPGMTEALRAKARERWAAWLGWYADKGYNANIAGSNYQAGYLLTATAVAIAEAGEAGGDGDALWTKVADELWGKDMAGGLAQGGVLVGGDWGEGWQYGPLAVAEYSLAARIGRQAGLQIDGISAWLAGLIRRHVYALSPSDGVYVGGDTEAETPNLPPNSMTLVAVALGDANPDDKRWARGELSRLKLSDHGGLLYDALAAVGEAPQLPPRASWPTSYMAVGTGNFYARTRWDDKAIWTVMSCVKTLAVDHHHADAGNVVLSRGADDVLVDPSPYGSLSTQTSNAPTVASAQLPANYIPGQGWWSEDTAWTWAQQTASGVIAARCDYADQYRFQERASDVPMATRDLVVVPSADGTDASLVVIDRASTKTAGRDMYLQFRTQAPLALDHDAAKGTLGGSQLVIQSVARSGGTPALGKPDGKECDGPGITRGSCHAARFPTTDYRVDIPGPEPRAVHVISAVAANATAPTATPFEGSGWAGVQLTSPRAATIVWPTGKSVPFTYTAPAGLHVILGGAAAAAITAKPSGAACAVTVPAGEAMAPAVLALDAGCAIKIDPAADPNSPPRPPAPAHSSPRSARSGCCGAEAAPGSSFPMAILVGLFVLRRRRR